MVSDRPLVIALHGPIEHLCSHHLTGEIEPDKSQNFQISSGQKIELMEKVKGLSSVLGQIYV
jgi:hypothetical protein